MRGWTVDEPQWPAACRKDPMGMIESTPIPDFTCSVCRNDFCHVVDPFMAPGEICQHESCGGVVSIVDGEPTAYGEFALVCASEDCGAYHHGYHFRFR